MDIAPPTSAPTCAICIGALSRPVELSCGHSFCWVCLAAAANHANYACPLCRVVHILDPQVGGPS